ncbi:hypothetical protein CAP35_06600 [Chitinophagaceae bacterium IBVUCB1]|nr:hypothetical protein CAP35_06600 [Chitinophagaceae bacterium IBVUCB1]
MDKVRKSHHKRNTLLIEDYIQKYSISKRPIAVNFRNKFPELNYERYSHLIHSYPAKLLVHIPYFFINNSYFSRKGDIVLDPFCGTGTVLLESILAGRNALGADANPLARMIANAKTTRLNEATLRKHLSSIVSRAKKYKKYELPDVVNCDYWFSESVQEKLSKLLRSINLIKNIDVRNFFLISYSNCIKKVSYADLRVSVPVKLNPNRFPEDSEAREKIKIRLKQLKNIDVFSKFQAIAEENIARISTIKEIDTKYKSKVISKDARNLTESINTNKRLKSNSVKLIVTSPPYAGAQKYIRASSLNLGWLGICDTTNLLKLDSQNIGRENYNVDDLKLITTGIKSADSLIRKLYKINAKRACIVGYYLNEMKDALKESVRVLKSGGHLVLIVGNNKVCDEEFNTQKYLSEYLQNIGLKLEFKLIDDIKSYGLMTKRNKTADIISREWILVFKKT